MLFVYALAFSFAYISLSTGTGALILFGAVQLTMILSVFVSGGRLNFSEWCGVSVAFAGLVYLVSPGLEAPSLSGFILMSLAGVSWGIYTLKGRGVTHPLSVTTANFVRTLPLLALPLLYSYPFDSLTVRGLLLAVLSGALASGVGYAIWYCALQGLSTTQAAVLQLLVPVLATVGGVIFMAETVSLRLALASLLILGGVGAALMGDRFIGRYRSSN
jgi:drug/metabolite transporter (DMT)-like permease